MYMRVSPGGVLLYLYYSLLLHQPSYSPRSSLQPQVSEGTSMAHVGKLFFM